MSPQQEEQVGQAEHPKILQLYGEVTDPALRSYVNNIGQNIAQYTERPDVNYTFTILDSPMVNAFAVPGGYIYVTRGLMALANDEAELAAVIAHEIGHITGRHSAARYSRSVLTSLGAVAVAAAVDSQAASQLAGLGSNLYIKSYSRGQENEADSLGLRYLTQVGYSPSAMGDFLASLERHSDLENRLNGGAGSSFSYFSTHPRTSDRVQKTRQEEAQYADSGNRNRDDYLRAINGMIYGDSARQGFVRGNRFIHPDLGFIFEAGQGYRIINGQTEVLIRNQQNGVTAIFDFGKSDPAQNLDAYTYMANIWMRGEPLKSAERIAINGLQAASAAFDGTVSGQPVTIRIVAIEWKPGVFARFQMAIPRNAPASVVEDLKRLTYSFKGLSAADKARYKPHRLRTIVADAGWTAQTLADRSANDAEVRAKVPVLNGLQSASQPLQSGQLYKIVTE